MGNNGTKVQSLDRAFQLIDIIANSPEAPTLNTITQLAGLPKPTVYRILSSLESWGYVELSKNKCYKLGVKFLQLGAQMQHELDIRKIAHPYLQELNNITKETIFLGIMYKGRGLYVDKLDGHYSIRLVSQVGSLNYLHSTALGKCLLADMTEGEVDLLLTKYGMPTLTTKTITNKDVLIAQLKNVRENGYAIDDVENEEGVRCVAAPVRDHEGKVVAAISISGPSSRITNESINGHLKAVLIESAQKVSASLGYRAFI
ncbi:transcriptional regulator, IclR family [Desulfotomaculum arcticum]|uniref:Transcriptional regulator, IclR family n=1 Tax=Desulfotruncus arcticus DSM 17038 TaxID=1121424 RepID=A0A1I2YGE5_9FIRM|nr:IclR family transcriptional regulator [Desulfotruncus arcticus]SFH24704.1 transcriptional regulator, IclR family [Desulfotomaculum arcticum] [Desulfotruncus arcticus DSM 17038]